MHIFNSTQNCVINIIIMYKQNEFKLLYKGSDCVILITFCNQLFYKKNWNRIDMKIHHDHWYVLIVSYLENLYLIQIISLTLVVSKLIVYALIYVWKKYDKCIFSAIHIQSFLLLSLIIKILTIMHSFQKRILVKKIHLGKNKSFDTFH